MQVVTAWHGDMFLKGLNLGTANPTTICATHDGMMDIVSHSRISYRSVSHNYIKLKAFRQSLGNMPLFLSTPHS